MSAAWDLSCRSQASSEQPNNEVSTTTSHLEPMPTGCQNHHHNKPSLESAYQLDERTLAGFLAAAAMARKLLPMPILNSSNQIDGRYQDEHRPSSHRSKPNSSQLIEARLRYKLSGSLQASAPTSPNSNCSPSSSSLLSAFSPLTSSFLSSSSDDLSNQQSASDNASSDSKSSRPLVSSDRRARKKDQNRRAAFNYRRKKLEERDRIMEEEAKLVHNHVRLTGKIARLERKILAILSTKTRKILDNNGYPMWHLCPVCLRMCENVLQLRNHLKLEHLQLALQPTNNSRNKSAKSNACRSLLSNLKHSPEERFSPDDSFSEDTDGYLSEDSATHKFTARKLAE